MTGCSLSNAMLTIMMGNSNTIAKISLNGEIMYFRHDGTTSITTAFLGMLPWALQGFFMIFHPMPQSTPSMETKRWVKLNLDLIQPFPTVF